MRTAGSLLLLVAVSTIAGAQERVPSARGQTSYTPVDVENFDEIHKKVIKESPPYLHDGRLLTLDDTVEFFNLVLALKLTEAEKRDLVAYLYAL